MRIAVFGATGRTGVPLCEQSVDRADVATCILDLLDGDEYVRAMPKIGAA